MDIIKVSFSYNLELNSLCLISVGDIRCCRKIHILAKYSFPFCPKYCALLFKFGLYSFYWICGFWKLTYNKIDFFHLTCIHDIIILILKSFILESFLVFLIWFITWLMIKTWSRFTFLPSNSSPSFSSQHSVLLWGNNPPSL